MQFIFPLLIFPLLIIGCGESNLTNKEDTYQKRVTSNIKDTEGEPSSFREYALVANGNIEIKGKLVTDGPLADIHSNGNIGANTRSLDISGQITSKGLNPSSVIRSFKYNKQTSYSKVRALKVDEFINTSTLSTFYHLKDDGTIEYNNVKINSDFATFQDGKWTISGKEVILESSLQVDTSLIINVDSAEIYGVLMVKGDLKSNGFLTVNNQLSFNNGLIVDSNIEVDSLKVTGRVFGSGNFTSNGDIEITGNIEIDKNIKFYGESNKINFLDNVYKASIFDSQNETNRTLRIADTKLFQDLNGKNSIMLFTYSKK